MAGEGKRGMTQPHITRPWLWLACGAPGLRAVAHQTLRSCREPQLQISPPILPSSPSTPHPSLIYIPYSTSPTLHPPNLHPSPPLIHHGRRNRSQRRCSSRVQHLQGGYCVRPPNSPIRVHMLTTNKQCPNLYDPPLPPCSPALKILMFRPNLSRGYAPQRYPPLESSLVHHSLADTACTQKTSSVEFTHMATSLLLPCNRVPSSRFAKAATQSPRLSLVLVKPRHSPFLSSRSSTLLFVRPKVCSPAYFHQPCHEFTD